MSIILIDDLPPIALDNRDRSPVPQWETPDATSLEEMVLPGTWPSVVALRRAFSKRLID